VAEVSGPASQSKRTDLGVLKQSTQPVQQYTGGTYGNNKAMTEQQTGAPLAGKPTPAPTPMSMPPMTPLGAPSQRPTEPITSGINMGDGPGTEVMRNMPNTAPNFMDTIKYLIQFDQSGDAELIYRTLLDNGY